GQVAGASTVFTFDVSCPASSQTFTLSVNTSSASSASTTDAIPTGVVCTITEQTPPTGWTDTSSSPANGQAVSGGTNGANTVTITNTRNLGHVSVAKYRAGHVAGASTVFTFDVSCPASSQSFTLTVDASSGTG